jgi:hypothetical protein
VPNEPIVMNRLTAPLVVRGVFTSDGPRNMVIVAGSSDYVYALEAESGQLLWQLDVGGEEKRPGVSTWLCPFALNATPVIDGTKSRLFVLSSDGRLHTADLADGHESVPPTAFVPPFSKMWSLNYSAGVLSTSISQDSSPTLLLCFLRRLSTRKGGQKHRLQRVHPHPDKESARSSDCSSRHRSRSAASLVSGVS